MSVSVEDRDILVDEVELVEETDNVSIPTLQDETPTNEGGEESTEAGASSGELGGYFSNWRPNRALRRYAARTNRKKIERAPASLRPVALRIVFRLDEDLTLGEELLVLGALEVLKKQHQQLKIVYCTRSKDIYTLLKKRWFLSEVHLIQNDKDFDSIVGDDIPMDISRPSPEEVELGEKKKYDKWFEAEVAEKNRLQQAATEKGMKDFKAQMPTYAFTPTWHLGNAFLWFLSENMGLPVEVPSEPIKPFGDVHSNLKRETLKRLRKSGLTDKPFVVYEFGENENEIVLLSALDPLFPDCQLVSRTALEKIVGEESLVGYLSILSHPNCVYVAGPGGILLTSAWAVGVPAVMEFYGGNNPRWDGCQAPNGFLINWETVPEEDKPRQLVGSVIFHLDSMDNK